MGQASWYIWPVSIARTLLNIHSEIIAAYLQLGGGPPAKKSCELSLNPSLMSCGYHSDSAATGPCRLSKAAKNLEVARERNSIPVLK
jgi:hypothetical protein